eukprot:GHUV01024284.1.p1 GENE.GHUV01024284.1~~GHUV01024284.1.p1  ORF type:complete len:110 (+),score=20.07 GHUV01024284.1:530-859(+)
MAEGPTQSRSIPGGRCMHGAFIILLCHLMLHGPIPNSSHLLCAGEPAFVARPGAKAEDDGVVVVPAVGADGNSFMAVLDAHSWKEIARVKLPYGTPHRFHGMWVPDNVK